MDFWQSWSILLKEIIIMYYARRIWTFKIKIISMESDNFVCIIFYIYNDLIEKTAHLVSSLEDIIFLTAMVICFHSPMKNKYSVKVVIFLDFDN